MYKYAIDNGFAQRCVSRGITSRSQIEALMKVAACLVKASELEQLEMAKRAELQKIALSDQQRNALIGGLGGGALGGGLGYMAGGDLQSALMGAGVGAGAGGAAGYLKGEDIENYLAGLREEVSNYPGYRSTGSDEEQPTKKLYPGYRGRAEEVPGQYANEKLIKQRQETRDADYPPDIAARVKEKIKNLKFPNPWMPKQ